MNLRERLRLLQGEAARSTPRPASPTKGEPAGQATVKRSPEAEPQETPSAGFDPATAQLDALLAGTLIPTPVGEAYCVERTFPLSYRRGTVAIGHALDVPARAWQRLTGADRGGALSVRDALFIDTETTGLERGTGTYAFLVGVGRFVGETFRIRQYFMRDYDEEEALLHALLDELQDASCLITFNGRSFDWPLLQTRATLSRLRLPDLPHIDLLHPSRRLWRPVTESCRLVHLEESILGLERYDDVPGHLIPQLYFEFLRTRDAAPLAGVITHNRLDILSTTALAAYLGEAAAEPLLAAPAGTPLPGSDLYALGRLLLERGEDDAGIAVLEEAVRRGLPPEMQTACRLLLAASYRRAHRIDEAVRTWHELASEGVSITPHVELAKFYEHRAKDYAEAKRWTLQAIEIVQRRRLLHGVGPRARTAAHPAAAELEALLHRLQRLDAKLARSYTRRQAR